MQMAELLRRLDDAAKESYRLSSEIEWIRARIGGTFAEEVQQRAAVEGRVARIEGALEPRLAQVEQSVGAIQAFIDRIEQIPLFRNMHGEKAREPESKNAKAPPRFPGPEGGPRIL